MPVTAITIVKKLRCSKFEIIAFEIIHARLVYAQRKNAACLVVVE